MEEIKIVLNLEFVCLHVCYLCYFVRNIFNQEEVLSKKKGKPLSAAVTGSLKISSCFFISIFPVKHWADRGHKTMFTSIVKRFPNFPIDPEIERINSAHLMKILLVFSFRKS